MKPPLACDSCRSRKKKCDRTYPICSYCLQTSRRCSYRVLHTEVQPNGVVTTKTDLQQPMVTAKYLDCRLLQLGTFTHQSDFPISTELRGMIESERAFDHYFEQYLISIDPWMPLIPRTYLTDCARTPFSLHTSEQILLSTCIKLLTKVLDEDNACTKDYLAIKVVFVHIEALGHITLRITQARFLLLLYEFGHGIHQAAFISLAVGMRYLTSLAIDNSHSVGHDHRDWLVEEQIRRLWWAGFVLERALCLGCVDRALQIKEPTRTKLLPSDEKSWHLEQYSPENALTLSSPATAHMGSFRLLVLASDLLGLALEYRADIQLRNADLGDHVQQLYRTLQSFAKVLEIEGQSDVSIGAPRCIINSTMFILDPNPQLFPPENMYKPIIDRPLMSTPRAGAGKIFLDRSRIYLAGGLARPDDAVPFLLHWAYHTFVFYYHAYHLNRGEEYQQALQDLTNVFWSLNQKWKLAGMYMKLVSATQLA